MYSRDKKEMMSSPQACELGGASARDLVWSFDLLLGGVVHAHAHAGDAHRGPVPNHLLATQSFPVRFGRSIVPTTHAVRGFPEHHRSSSPRHQSQPISNTNEIINRLDTHGGPGDEDQKGQVGRLDEIERPVVRFQHTADRACVRQRDTFCFRSLLVRLESRESPCLCHSATIERVLRRHSTREASSSSRSYTPESLDTPASHPLCVNIRLV